MQEWVEGYMNAWWTDAWIDLSTHRRLSGGTWSDPVETLCIKDPEIIKSLLSLSDAPEVDDFVPHCNFGVHESFWWWVARALHCLPSPRVQVEEPNILKDLLLLATTSKYEHPAPNERCSVTISRLRRNVALGMEIIGGDKSEGRTERERERERERETIMMEKLKKFTS